MEIMKLPNFSSLPSLKDCGGLKGIFFSSMIAYQSYRMVSNIWKYIRPLPNFKTLYPASWAIITGGTSGIGRGIAHELGKNGLNLILIARNLENLQQTAETLMSTYPEIKVIWISLDATNPAADFGTLMKTISQYPISVLVNNVGVHNHLPANTDDLPLEEISRIIRVNCIFQVQLTSLVIPLMKESRIFQTQPRIINISSLTSQLPMPMLSVYAASKAFMDHWSTNLAAELAPENIRVMCLRPGLTVSLMSGETKPSLFVPSAETMARACVRMMMGSDLLIVPYLPHRFLDALNHCVPTQLQWSIVRKMHQEKRDRLLESAASSSLPSDSLLPSPSP
jgi:17beta-estradiol 17-dehydrogenase / very-long-chain 3-oxoacyl-CoA reductase